MNPPNNKSKRLIKINAITQANLIKLLIEGIYTCQELADETGLHYVTVLQYTRELHRAGAAYICRWEKDRRGRDMKKIYKIGRDKDDAKRQKQTPGQRQANGRARAATARLLGVLA